MKKLTRKELEEVIDFTEIRKQLESNKCFQYEKKEIGLSFEDFDLIDKESNSRLLSGKKDIGNYILYLENGLIDSAVYDFR